MRRLQQYFAIAGLVMIFPASANAQKGTTSIGAHGGVNISKLCCGSLAVNEDYKFGEGPTFGLTASYGLNNWLSLATELNYATQGGKKTGMQAVMTNGSTLYADFENKTVLNYLELPVMARATFGTTIKYYANVGTFAGYLLSAKQKTSGASAYYLDAAGTNPYTSENNKVSFNTDKDIKSDVNAFNFGLVGGIGAGYTFGKHGIWIDGRYSMGIPNIRKNIGINGENSTGSILAMVAYTYTISK